MAAGPVLGRPVFSGHALCFWRLLLSLLLPPYYAAPPVYAAPYPAPSCPLSCGLSGARGAQSAPYTIYFEFDRDQLTAQTSAVVQRVAAAYRAGGNPPVQVIGHTDRAGTPPYNVALSRRRAETVRNALISAGIPARAISIAWRGEDEPAVDTPQGAREPRNRRVLVIVGAGPIS
jgi:outer membrane protein OmpA-like peptidoglycan-associated protein